MYDVLRMGRKAFTVSVVVATLAWSLGVAALLVPLAAGAATLSSGDLIKASLPAVYYYGADGKRYVFPNEKTYKTWYADFSSVKTITDAELAAVTIGGNATYKPGVKMVKITTDPKVYAVDANGTLRWVNSETMAGNLYGANWNKMIEDVPDAFFTNYKVGADVAQASDYNKDSVLAAAANINVDKGLATVGGGTGALTIAADAATPAAASVVVDSDTGATDTDSGQQRAQLLKVKFTAGSAEVKVTGLKFKRGGISKDGDVDNVLLMDGKAIIAEAQSVSDAVATFNLSSGLVTIPANSSKTLDVAVNLNKAVSSGSTLNWSLAAADVTSNAASVSGSAVGNSMTVATVSDLGQLEIGQTNTAPASVDPGVLAKEMWRVSFNAMSQDVIITYVKFNNLGSSYDADIQNLKLMDGATQLNGTVAQVKDKVVEFDLTTMTGGGYKILAGQSKQLTLNGDIVGGTSRTFRWSVQKQEDVRVKDLEYGVDVFVDDYDATKDNSFGVVQASAATDINTGTLNVGLAPDSPSTYVTDGGTGLTFAKFNFKASGEDVKITALTVICLANTTTDDATNVMVKLDGVQVGSTDSTMNCDDTTDEATYTFGNTFILTAGKTHAVTIVGDLSDSAWAVDDTIRLGFGGTATAQGKSSLTAITPSNVNGQTLTLKGATVTVIKDLSFTDRSSTAPTGVNNASGVKLGSFAIVGGSGEAADVSQIVLRDGTTDQAAGEDFQNLVLKDRAGSQIGTSVSSLNTASAGGTYTFTPGTSIRIKKGEQLAFDVFADVKGSVTNAATAFTLLEVDTVSATGVDTGTSANFGTSGNDATDVALQKVYLANHGNLTIDEAADTPVAQQLVLGSTGAELAKFKLSASAAEDITVTELFVNNDMSTGFANSIHEKATGSLKNFKLYNGSTLLATVASLDETNNSTSPYASFNGFTLTIPKNQNVTLTVKADLASYDDGGAPSSTHRLFIAADYKTINGGIQVPVVAVGAGSGITMSLLGLDMAGGTSAGLAENTDTDVKGSYMDLVRAKLTLAHAADSPSGASATAAEQTVAKFLATNSANVGNYTLTIQNMNFSISSTSNSITAASDLSVYKDSVSSANVLRTTTYPLTSQATYLDTAITEANFTNVEVAAGSSKTILVTIGTNNGGFTSSDTLSVGIAANDILWVDGGTTGSGGTATYYSVDSLPLTGKTLVY